jgi:hypothetical protein
MQVDDLVAERGAAQRIAFTLADVNAASPAAVFGRNAFVGPKLVMNAVPPV